MQSDDEAPLTLSKWPFYLGDIILVGIALVIATLGQWQLSDWQVASCVIAVALGAALFVVPFVVEYNMRFEEEADDRSSEMRLQQADIKRFEAALVACHERIKALESASGSARHYELLASAVDQKFSAAAQTVAGLSIEVAAIEGFKADQVAAFNALKEKVAELNAGLGGSTAGGADLDALQASLKGLDVRLSQTAQPIESIEARLKVLEGAAATPTTQETTDRPAPRAPRQRRTSDSGLLQRAMQEKQDSSSTAVSRIIDAKLKLKPPADAPVVVQPAAVPIAEQEPTEPIETPEPTELSEPIETPEPTEIATSADTAKTADGPVEASEPEFESLADAEPEGALVAPPAELDESAEVIEVSPDAELAEEMAALESGEEASVSEQQPQMAAAEATEPERVRVAVEDCAATATATVDDEALAEAPAEDLFGEVVKPLARHVSAKKNDAVFTVNILIGIGNKPYLRGSGGGLSWEAGVPMEFEEIGKWRWLAPSDLDASVEVQVFRNDEDADRNGTHLLEPGQNLEVTPVF